MHNQWANDLIDYHPTLAAALGYVYIVVLILAVVVWWLTKRGKK
jgi:hypothetical protein